MLQIDDIGEIIKESLRYIEIECEILEKIRPGQQRTEWVLGVRQRIAAAEKLLSKTEAKCLSEVLLIGDAQIDLLNQLTKQVKGVAKQFPDNQCAKVQAASMEVVRKNALELLAQNALELEALIKKEFRQLRVEIKFLAVKTKSL